MDAKWITGWESNGIPSGNRDFRESKKNIGSQMFRNPQKLILNIIKLLIYIIYIPIRNMLRRLNPKPKSLRGKVCFVTGSGRGLGREICIALAKEGAIIACADINEENNNKTVEILREMGVKAKAYKLNVADKQEVESVAKSVETDLGRVYLVVNNAALVLPCPEVTEEYTRAIFGVNALGPVWTSMVFLPNMKKANEGHILNISSIASCYGIPNGVMYGATKAALTNYAQGLRLELRYQGYDICVTTVHPGIINTSADITDSVDSRLRILEANRVARWIINCVKYNKTDATNEPFYSFIMLLSKFFPLEVIDCAINLLDITVTLPTLEEYKKLKIYDTVLECNKIVGRKS